MFPFLAMGVAVSLSVRLSVSVILSGGCSTALGTVGYPHCLCSLFAQKLGLT